VRPLATGRPHRAAGPHHPRRRGDRISCHARYAPGWMKGGKR
jgi:hypothetical protein